MPDKSETPAAQPLALTLLIVFIALNLRPFLAAPGPILPRIAEDTGFGLGALSLLTLLPMLLMGIGAFATPHLLTSVGTRRGVMLGMCLVFLGCALRIFAAHGSLLTLTAVLCGAGVAVVQSTVPGLIKERFAARVAGMTGLYSAMIMAGGALGAQSVPFLVERGMPWTTALALLAVPVFLAGIAAAKILPQGKASRPTPGLVADLVGRRRSWVLMAVFGLINGGYSSMIAWLAPYYQAHGWSSSDSGFLISVMALCQGVGAILLPLLARKSADRRPWIWLCIALQIVGFLGLASAPLLLPILWVALCGVGLAGSFALCLIVALDHLPDPSRAGALAALMQGGGFILAATPPFLLAIIEAKSGSFAGGWIMHLTWLGIAAILVSRFDPKSYPDAMERVTCRGVRPPFTT